MSTQEPDIMGPFVEKLRKTYEDRGGVSCDDLVGDEILGSDRLIRELVFSLLMWEASIAHAVKAAARISEELVDLNELRVCTPEELVGIIGPRYPRGLDRARRLTAVLTRIFHTENRLSLAVLGEMNKRDVLEYFARIDGIPPFAANRVILLGLGWHAFPVDERLAKLLAGKDIADSSLDIAQQTQRLERMVRASEAKEYYTLIEHWSQSQRTPRSGSRAGSGSGTRSGSGSGSGKPETSTDPQEAGSPAKGAS
ncbi:MAG: hypothetical protein WD114_02600 [Phycisphaerales bacterium]